MIATIAFIYIGIPNCNGPHKPWNPTRDNAVYFSASKAQNFRLVNEIPAVIAALNTN